MKRLLAILLALVLIVGFSVPAMAQDVTTGVTVTQGGGNIPVVKCKWETPDDGDPDHTTTGTQVNPPVTFNGTKTMTLYVVVTDVEDWGSVAQVVADIYHPSGEPENGSIKYDNLELSECTWTAGMDAFEAAAEEDLVWYFDAFDYEEVWDELDQGDASVWAITFIMHYCQPAGDYLVQVMAVDTHGNSSTICSNYFTYVAICGVEIDFTSVTYPNVMISSMVVAQGDNIFSAGDGYPTIRNIGNTNAYVWILQDDMGFGTYSSGEYKVEYDARLGPKADDDDSTNVVYDPYEDTMLPNALPLCNTKKLDFSIHVKMAVTGSYTGTMDVTCTIAPF